MPEVQVDIGLKGVAVLQAAARALKEEADELLSGNPYGTATQPPDPFAIRLSAALTRVSLRLMLASGVQSGEDGNVPRP